MEFKFGKYGSCSKDSTQMPPIYVPVLGSKKRKLILKYTHSLFMCVFFFPARQSGTYSSPTQRAVICKDTIQKISCPPEQKIRILNADYGDTGNVGCLKEANPVPSGPCRTPGAYETVKRECEGYEDCELSASNGVFGNACPDANKYLDVSYDCANNAGKLAK